MGYIMGLLKKKKERKERELYAYRVIRDRVEEK